MKIIFLGDLFLNRSKDLNLLSPFPNYNNNYKIVGNIESSISEIGTITSPKYANLRSHPESFNCLKGLEVAILSNNHFCDYGHESAQETVKELRRLKIQTTGYGSNLNEAMEPAVLSYGTNRVAIISFCCPSTNGWNDASCINPGVSPLNLSIVKQRIFQLKEIHNFVIVYLHWGLENNHAVTTNQIWAARKMIDWGAESVIGTHGHVIQPMEIYKGKYIFYGLGNTVFEKGNYRLWEPDGKYEEKKIIHESKNRESIAPVFQINAEKEFNYQETLNLKYDNEEIIRCKRSELSIDIDELNMVHKINTILKSKKINSHSLFSFKIIHTGILYKCDYIDKPYSNKFASIIFYFIRFLKRILFIR